MHIIDKKESKIKKKTKIKLKSHHQDDIKFALEKKQNSFLEGKCFINSIYLHEIHNSQQMLSQSILQKQLQFWFSHTFKWILVIKQYSTLN